MKTRIIAPIFVSALNVIASTLLLLFVMFSYGGDATGLALFWLMVQICHYGLTVMAYREGRGHRG